MPLRGKLMNKYTEINEKLYKLLKEPLELSDRCVGFTLTVSMEKPPEVKQTYYCQSKDGQPDPDGLNLYCIKHSCKL